MPLTKNQIAHLRALHEKKSREQTGRFIVEGAKVVGELVAAGYPFLELYTTDAWAAPPDAAASVVAVSAAEMARISHYPTPSVVLGVGAINRPILADGELSRGLTLALDGVQDPGNVGTLLRIADWFAFDRVLCSPDCADVFTQKVLNASMGSFARLRIIRTPLAPLLPSASGPIIGCDLAGQSVYKLSPLTSGVVVIGSEGRGLSPEVSACVTQRVTIPRLGGAESLNAAVAAGIVCAHLRRPPN